MQLWHRHLPRARPGELAAFGVWDEAGVCRGVAQLTRPGARLLDDGSLVEVARVATDGTPNACSALYGACCRWAWRHTEAEAVITYTLQSEPGTSLRAAGFVEDGWTEARESWGRDGRPREARQGENAAAKRRWRRERPAKRARHTNAAAGRGEER